MGGRPWRRALSLVLATGFAWSAAAVNSTSTVREDKDLCNQVRQINCTDTPTTAPQLTHFSECPPSFEGYCIHGQCRFLTSEQQPSCICKLSYTGSRCEMVDMLYITGERDKYIIMGLVLAMVVLIVLIFIICLCVHRYRRKCKGTRKWRPGVKAVNTQTVEEGNALGHDEDTAMTTLA
ncbi:protransforming growth factor alpha-like [Amblyraja radiata]|uniref:protransforming growth factor alpha-like n=1 Tax=Amblyraja radiata TaxID=386614 RepID=UPI001403B89E|nr:protransforming growth factor alpha-like [Amblyraja radiata]